MKLFKISQEETSDYDIYDSAVVAAPDEETARKMNRSNGEDMSDKWNDPYNAWCSSADKVTVEYLGEAAEGIEQGIICTSFNSA